MEARRRDAEVGDQRVAVLVEQHVVGLHVAMHDAAAMRVVERARDLRRTPTAAGLRRDRALALHQQVGQRAAARDTA